MEKDSKVAVVPLDYIRALVVFQNGRCAITGVPLDPKHVNADHINPLSRNDLSGGNVKENVWLVHKKINAKKGTLPYDELILVARQIIQNHENALKLLNRIKSGKITPISKDEFDKWVIEHCSENGKVKAEENPVLKAMDE